MENKIDRKNFKHWTIADDMYILYEIINRCSILKHKTEKYDLDFMETKRDFLVRVSQEIGVDENSLKMRIKNHLSFLTNEKEGLSNYAYATELALKKYLKKYSASHLYMYIKSII
jgi:hypothetical protein